MIARTTVAGVLLGVAVAVGAALVGLEDWLEGRTEEAVRDDVVAGTTLRFVPSDRVLNFTRWGLPRDMAVSAASEAERMRRGDAALREVLLGSNQAVVEAALCAQDRPMPFSAVPVMVSGERRGRRVIEPLSEDFLAPSPDLLQHLSRSTDALVAAYRDPAGLEWTALALAPLLVGGEQPVAAADPGEVAIRRDRGLDDLLLRFPELVTLLPQYLGRSHALRELVGEVLAEGAPPPGWPCRGVVLDRDPRPGELR